MSQICYKCMVMQNDPSSLDCLLNKRVDDKAAFDSMLCIVAQ